MSSPLLPRLLSALFFLTVATPSVWASGPPALTCPTATGREATLVLNVGASAPALPVTEGWVVVSTPSTSCVGQATWHPGLRTLTIHGDDPLTQAVDGAQVGEPLQLHLYNAGGLVTSVVLSPTLDARSCVACNSDLVYEHDRLYVISRLELGSTTDAATVGAISEASVRSLYPNPAQEGATIEIALPASELVRVSLYDVLGREVRRLYDELFPAGVSRPYVETAGLASGSYLLRVSGESFATTRSLTVIE